MKGLPAGWPGRGRGRSRPGGRLRCCVGPRGAAMRAVSRRGKEGSSDHSAPGLRPDRCRSEDGAVQAWPKAGRLQKDTGASTIASEPAVDFGLSVGHLRGLPEVAHPGPHRRLLPREPCPGGVPRRQVRARADGAGRGKRAAGTATTVPGFLPRGPVCTGGRQVSRPGPGQSQLPRSCLRPLGWTRSHARRRTRHHGT